MREPEKGDRGDEMGKGGGRAEDTLFESLDSDFDRGRMRLRSEFGEWEALAGRGRGAGGGVVM